MILKDVHKDMERYLEYDCYCPGEIYDVSGFSFRYSMLMRSVER